ncbi:MAG: T9SS type A sorting domain-containing protein [Bacteroidota bacterium]|nr:T9SS type A sorting domain-containing protein [Bacteroidota bacterium]
MKKIIFILFLCIFGYIETFAQNVLVVEKTDQTEETFDLGSNGSVSFIVASEQNPACINIVDNEGVFLYISIDDIQKIYFKNTLSLNDLSIENEIFVYPNPAKDYLKIFDNSPSKKQISLYSLDGKLILQSSVVNNESVDISFLEKGIYLLKCNGQTFKFSKL